MPVQYLPDDPADQWESVPLPEFEPDGPTVLVVQATLASSDEEADTWTVSLREYESMRPAAFKPDELIGLIREGGSVSVVRHYSWDHRKFWDAIRASLGKLGVQGRAYGREPGPVFHDDYAHGFYTYVKELEGS